MKKTIQAAVGILCLTALGSCSIERQTFTQGDDIEWRRKNVAAIQERPEVSPTEIAASTEMASVDNSFAPIETEAPVVFEQAPEAPAKNVQAERRSMASRSSVDASVIEEEVLAMQTSDVQISEQVQGETTMTTPAPGSGGKSQLVALILCFFFGIIGVHRFYLGYTWQGIVQILTLGGLGIWALIDLIRIIIGDLEPKDGSYDKTL